MAKDLNVTEEPEVEAGEVLPPPLRDTQPWGAAAYAGAAFTLLTAVPLLVADADNAIPLGILAGAVAFVVGGLWMNLTRKGQPAGG